MRGLVQFRLAGALVACASGLVAAAPACAQGSYSPYDESPSAALARYVRTLASDPTDFQSLIGAGKAALELGDAQAAGGFFARADDANPRSPLPQAGMGAVSVANGDPQAALPYFQRAQQLAALKQQDLFSPVIVADYLLDKDKLFARVTLDEAEYALYEQVSTKLEIDCPKPDLVVYLQAPVDVLLERISKRGISYEQTIDRQYLTRLNEAYARFFHEYDRAPLLIVNAASIDPVANQADYDELVGAIRRMKKGRMYYNPMRHGTI